jgi:hypothetical protein
MVPSITVSNMVTLVTVVTVVPWSPHFGSNAVIPHLRSSCIRHVISDCRKPKYKLGGVLQLN